MKARLPQGMGGGAQNMQNMIRQAQKMQEQITNVQEEIENETFTATTGGGVVEITMNGRKQVQSLTIKPEVVDKDDVETLQDLIISAVNECVKQIEETSESKMGAVTGGVSFPGLF
ncbi:MAG: YbaB/EbfC family nucleoid-associated protein [Oscillospiraceae bacterium]|jgi:DNA-binding YbaB/EbfC family protein|nr:YbaB/EbfC family nucleoid-associated protein [Oscillospiraceae bacterium]MCI7498826.1 YbaB/EbfC family nucleoid-associated protein [Oscillospiraceae bacterium]MDD7278756.1 YbaB/EbfC family nucleoid-associated protein [Oscillospiraceae bacterium]MDY2864492.1 YbaB/EbfC family nucleoid-associated protein [Oscillospiraceae bacterium]